MISYSASSLAKVLSEPKTVQSNRLDTRAYYLPNNSISLNGKWDFSYAASPLRAPVPGDGLDSFKTQLTVPGHWQLQGFGNPHYTNVVYPFNTNPPHPPSENPTGTYKRYFYVPDNWDKDLELRLRFEGVDNSYHVFVNSHLVGYNEGSRNAAEFDISDYVKKGPNEIWVRVYQWSSSSYIEDQDQWWLSGIYRDVYLLGFDRRGYIEDFKIDTDFDDSFTNSQLRISLNIKYTGNAKLNVKLEKDKVIFDKQFDLKSFNFLQSFEIKNPLKWTAESPNLYKLTLQVSVDNIITSEVRQDVGFRKVEIKDGILKVNGKRILIKGVNRHDHHPKYGRAVPLDFIKRDLEIMKQHNINAIRTSHYPNHPYFYELANKLGFWILDEADLECHGFFEAVRKPLDASDDVEYGNGKRELFQEAKLFTSDNPDWEIAYVDRARQLVKRDINQPSVIIWSLGNEAFFGRNHVSMVKEIRENDPSRPIHYEGDLDAEATDFYSRMYSLLETVKTFIDKDKPFILCEYAHAMGNSPGLLRQYQDLFYSHERLQGGFIWEWANHGIEVEKNGEKVYYYGGDFGEYPHDGVFIMDGLLDSRHNPTPGLIEYKKVIEPIVSTITKDLIEVKNMFDFIDLKNFNANYKVISYDGLTKDVIKCGILELPEIKPGESTKIPLPEFQYPKNTTVYFEVEFRTNIETEVVPLGHLVAWSQKKLQSQEIRKNDILSNDYNVEESDTFIKIYNETSLLIFDKLKGVIRSWKSDTYNLITNGHNNLTFWRPSINNDAPIDEPYWKKFGLDHMVVDNHKVTVDKVLKDGLVAIITVDSRISPPILAWGFDTRQIYKIYENEILILTELQVTGFSEKCIPKTIPRLGYEFSVDNSLGDFVKWFGRGPGESYADKKESQRIDLYRSEFGQLDYNYDYPQENGNHVDTEWLLLETENDKGLFVHSNDTFDFKVSDQYNVQEAMHPHEIKRGNRYVRIDYKQHGVGTGACGPSVLDEFEFKLPRKLNFDVSLSIM